MRVALPVALLAALAVAAPAMARAQTGAGSAIGHGQPLRAYASVTPPVQLFGDSITARLTVLADTRFVNPARLRIGVSFAPYEPAKPPTVARTASGRFLEETWTWTLRCLDVACVPVAPPSDLSHVFHFARARVRYVGRDGKIEYSLRPRFAAVEVLSEVSPAEVSYVTANKSIDWAYQLAPATAAPYRLAPALVFWIAVALAAALGAAGLVVAGRWTLGLRAPATAAATPALPPSYLERALALFFWAKARGDETLQRKALERVADELPLDVIDLSETARELAWSPATPEGGEVEAISERAGVPTHHENGSER